MSMPYLGIPRPPQQPVQLDSTNVTLHIRQQPSQALVTLDNKEKVRKPIDPPPIVEMKVGPYSEQNDQWLVSPYLFMIATLLEGKSGDSMVAGRNLIGGMTSSLHRLKDITNKDGGFFIFGDISVRVSGTFRLRFNLFNTDKDTGFVTFISSVDSKPFDVVTNKEFRGLAESTHLSRTFSDQGVRLRLRKEARSLGGNGTSLKRVHGGMSSPTESYAQQHPQTSGFGGPVGDAHYSNSYGTPVKRQRSDSGPTNPHPYPAFANNSSSFYASNPAMGRSFTTQGQNFPPGQDFMSFNLPQAAPGATLPPSTGAASGASITDSVVWSRPVQQSAMPASAGGMPMFAFGRSAPTPRSMYFDPQQSRMQYPSQPQNEGYTGYGLATPTSNPDNAIGQSQSYTQSQPDFNNSTANGPYQQELGGDFGPFETRSTSGDPTATNLHATAHPNASGLSFDHLPQGSTGQYQNHQPATTQGSLNGINNMFDVPSGFTSTSGSFETAGTQNTASMNTLNSEWSGAPYGTPQPSTAQRLPQQSMEPYAEHQSSGYPTPQTAKWPH